MLYELAKKYDDVLFILNHTGEPCYQDQKIILKAGHKIWKKLASCDNFVTKISGLGMFDTQRGLLSLLEYLLKKQLKYLEYSKMYVCF